MTTDQRGTDVGGADQRGTDQRGTDGGGTEQRWRPVVAALLNPRARRVLADVLSAEVSLSGGATTANPRGSERTAPPPLGTAERRRAETVLRSAGLITEDGRFDEATLRGLLAARTPTPRGVDRWLRDERIEMWPSGADDRDELLRWARERIIRPGEHLDEREITERIAALTSDPLRLRRALVDAGLLDRENDGTDYRRAG